MLKPAIVTVLCFTVFTACSDRLTAPEAVELVNAIEKSLADSGAPRRWLGGDVFDSDLRLKALGRATLRRDDEVLSYQAIVFERVVRGSLAGGRPGCAGTRRAAFFRRAGNDGVVFFPTGWFDERLVGAVHCGEGPVIRVVIPEESAWMADSLGGDISPGTVTGRCGFLKPEDERLLREDFALTCELTSHRVRFAARLQGFIAGQPQTMRFALDSAEIVGVRYTVDCTTAKHPRIAGCIRQSQVP